jgi:hypothetical protein
MVSVGSLVVAAGAHGAACWGEQSGFTTSCQEALIDGFTIPISFFGGKAFEPFAEPLAGPLKGGFMGLCDWMSGQISEILKKLATGG